MGMRLARWTQGCNAWYSKLNQAYMSGAPQARQTPATATRGLIMKSVFVAVVIAATAMGVSGCASIGSGPGTDLNYGQATRSSMQLTVEHRMRTAADEQGLAYLSMEDMKNRNRLLRKLLKIKFDTVSIE
jgi:hypothetical protein